MFHAATKSFTNASFASSACVDFRECSELGVRTEEEVDTGAGPLEVARRAIATLILAVDRSGLPFRVHVEQVDEEIIRQRLEPVGEEAVFGLLEISIQGAQAAHEQRHLGSSQRKQLRSIHQPLLSGS